VRVRESDRRKLLEELLAELLAVRFSPHPFQEL
jgi:hypothetical protein